MKSDTQLQHDVLDELEAAHSRSAGDAAKRRKAKPRKTQRPRPQNHRDRVE